MAKTLSPINNAAYCNEELPVLKGIIDYSDQMIADEGKQSAYASLRRHAYGKTVVIDTEKKGRLIFRLSSTALIYPLFKSGYATPHSPVGRLCSYLRPGDLDESPAWGEYKVVEIRLFDRFDGLLFEKNVRNFLRMVVDGQYGKVTVSDLQLTLRNTSLRKPEISMSLPIISDPLQKSTSDISLFKIINEPSDPTALQLARFEIAEDDVEAIDIDADDTDEVDVGTSGSSEEYFGLSEVFYVNRTRQQDEVVARSPTGPMFVEGVAGSGKTSAALGRTKMLCDFNGASVTDEATFRDIAGNSLDYWSEQYTGKFSQAGSIGFVRTGELIQYLKATCHRIELPHLPVFEFKELQVRLRRHRKVENSRIPGWKWGMQTTSRVSELDTSMAWLASADHSLATLFATQFMTALPDAIEISGFFLDIQRPKITKVAAIALEVMRVSLLPILIEMRKNSVVGDFKLDKLAEQIQRKIREMRNKVLSSDVLWIVEGSSVIYASNEYSLVPLLIKSNLPLYSRNSERLVILNEDGPVDSSLTFFSQDGSLLEWSDEVRQQIANKKVTVKDNSGLVFLAVASDVKDLLNKLLPESNEKLYVIRGGKLGTLSVSKGLGKAKFELLNPQIEKFDDDDVDEEKNILRFKTIDSVINKILNSSLLQPLTYLADTYMESLKVDADNYPDPSLARKIHAQMQDKKLSSEDVDLLLCLSHIVGRGFEGNLGQLKVPDYYESVFIDEVQDFTEQQVFLMAEQAMPEYRAVTVVGDIAQKLHHGSQINIQACFPDIKVAHVSLTENLRQLESPGLGWFSACFRTMLHDGLVDASPTVEMLHRLTDNARHIKGPELHIFDGIDEMDDSIVDFLKKVPPGQTAAVILPDSVLAFDSHRRLNLALANNFIDTEFSDKVDLSRRHLRHFTSVTNAKGLEFDVVILPFIEKYDLEDRMHINRLYVGITRARKKLVLLAANEIVSGRFDAVWARYKHVISQFE